MLASSSQNLKLDNGKSTIGDNMLSGYECVLITWPSGCPYHYGLLDLPLCFAGVYFDVDVDFDFSVDADVNVYVDVDVDCDFLHYLDCSRFS